MDGEDYSDVILAATPPATPKLRKTVRGAEKLTGVQPELVEHWNNLQGEFDKAGLSAAIKSGYRTAAQQNSLHRRGYPTKGNDGYVKISPHQEGRALDISFSGAQKPKGREIIAAYAKQHGLYTPPDEPWHIAIPKAQRQAQQDDYADIIKAATPNSIDDYADIISAATPSVTKSVTKQPSAEEALKGLMADATRRTAQIKPVAPKPVGMGDVQQASRETGRPSTVDLTSDDLRVMKGEQPTDRLAYQRQGELQERAGTRKPTETFTGSRPSMQAREKGLVERGIEKVKEYAPGLANLDTPMGVKTDPLRGAASLGLADLSREVSPEERALDPEAQSKANLAYGIGQAAPAVLPYMGAGKVAEALIPGATRGAAAARTAATFGGVGALREGVRSAQTGESPNLSNVAIDTAIGAAMGGIAGIDPSLKRQIIAFVTPSVVAGVAKGEKPSEIAQTAVTNLLFGLHSGTGPKRLTAERIGKLREQLGGSRVSEVRDAFDAIKDGVPEKPSAMQAQLEARGYTLVPEGTQRPPLPRGTRAERTPDGVVYYDPKRIDAATIRNTPTTDLLGHVEPKSETTTETVVARDRDGSEIQSSAVSPENVQKQAEVTQSLYPEAKVETGGPELAADVIAERTAPNLPIRFEHPQHGAIEVTESQEGAKNDRLRVAEISDPSKIHYVKRADLLPLKPEPSGIEPIRPSPESAVYGPSSGTDAMMERVRTESAAAAANLSPEARAGIEAARTKLASEAPETKGEQRDVIPTAENVPSETVDTSGGNVGDSVPSNLREASSVKNAATEELRSDLELSEIERPEKKSFQTSIDNAVAKGLDKNAEKIADDVIAGNREVGLDNEQAAGVLIKMRELENEWETRYQKNASDPELQNIKSRLDKLSLAADLGGTAPARDLAFRRSMVDKEFRLINLIRTAEKAKGRTVTAEETQRYADLVKERDQAIKDRDVALEQLHTRSLQSELDRSTRQRKRSETKQTLDEEAVVIKSDIMAEIARLKTQVSQGKFLSQGGLGALDPEGVITKGALKYARNRAKAGGIKAQELIDEVHEMVKDLGASRRQVAELLAGGTQAQKQRADWVKELAKVRSEIADLIKTEDVEAGRRSLKREGPPNVVKRNAQRVKQLEAREAELVRKTEAREFDPKAKREPFPYDRSVRAAEDRVSIAEAKFKKEMERAKGGHQLRNASGVLKAWLLSGPSTQIKNTLGTMGWQGFEEQSRVFASAMDSAISAGRKALGKDAQRGIMGVSPSAIIDSLKFTGKVGVPQAIDILKRGATKEQMERHQYNEIDFGVNTKSQSLNKAVKTIELAHNVIFRFMSASDRLFYQFAHQRNLIDRATVAAKNEGLKGEALKARVEELKQNERIDADARYDALVSTFNNDNALSTRIKRARAKVVNPRSTLSGKAADRINAAENLALDFILPFDRTPTNVISRIVEASPAGYLKNASQLVRAAVNKSMDAEAQRNFSRTFGRASAGTINMALGAALVDKLIYIDDQGNAWLTIGGRKFNLNSISPLGNLIALGARLKKAADDPKSTTADFVKPALREPANLPLLRATNNISELVRDPERSAGKTGARFANMLVPFSGLVRDTAGAIDAAERRVPDSSFREQFIRNIPKARETLPASRVRLLGSDVNKATKEAERLGITIKGATKQEDESDEDFKKRQAVTNGNIRTQIENVVALPEYDKASDEDKGKWLKQASEFASSQTREQLPEKPEKKEERQFPMPQTQSGFSRAYPADALDRYERASVTERVKMRSEMTQKARILLSDPRLSDEQKTAFKARLDALGLTVRPRSTQRQLQATP